MQSVITVTINPCIDKSSSIDRLVPEKKLRCAAAKYEPGGGGINVSRAIQKLGGSSTPVYLGGGHASGMLQSLLQQEHIAPVIIPVQNNTRENFIVYETSTGNQFRFGMPGPHVSENELQQCIDTVANMRADYIVASGSLPTGIAPDFYGRLGKAVKKNNTKYIVDTSGDAIAHALQEKVYLWKPNLGELSAFAGYSELDTETAMHAAKKVIAQQYAEIIVVSLGAAGAMLVTATLTKRIEAPVVKRKSTVGAGDSMVAGIVYSLANGSDIIQSVQYGVACGSAATMNHGTELCRKEDVDRLYRELYA